MDSGAVRWRWYPLLQRISLRIPPGEEFAKLLHALVSAREKTGWQEEKRDEKRGTEMLKLFYSHVFSIWSKPINGETYQTGIDFYKFRLYRGCGCTMNSVCLESEGLKLANTSISLLFSLIWTWALFVILTRLTHTLFTIESRVYGAAVTDTLAHIHTMHHHGTAHNLYLILKILEVLSQAEQFSCMLNAIN